MTMPTINTMILKIISKNSMKLPIILRQVNPNLILVTLIRLYVTQA